MQIDTSTDFGKKVLRRLQNEQVIWLTTVASDGTPQPNPVWFLWDGETILIYTQPKAKKLANLRRNPKVSLHFDAGRDGEDVVVFSGEARIEKGFSLAHQNPPYVEKYRQGIASLDMNPEDMGSEYSVALRITPTRMRGW